MSLVGEVPAESIMSQSMWPIAESCSQANKYLPPEYFPWRRGDGIVVWLDGTFRFGATAPGVANLNEYDIDVASLAAGAHALQILRADHGGATGYAIAVDAQDVAVPEPSSLLLTGLSLAGLRVMRRKKATSR